ncbi:hypothetical protein ALO_10219 [Acetonema longum DSM 6540]|uniref:Uncharacterized protein n=1 Tax=Acetonema longum DSM 6540 TaxID=1009370 RepID=F7NIZ1_9FIRM|nr:hypothetical protein ALO_10219 [Acetonema longum DSM 6540]
MIIPDQSNHLSLVEMIIFFWKFSYKHGKKQ